MKKGWETKTLGDLFEITSSKRVFEADWTRQGVPFYRAREIVKLAKQGFVDNELFISEQMFKQYSTKYGIPTPGDIMVTGVGTLGICYVVKEGDRFYFKDGNIIWLKKRSDADSSFVEYAFQSDFLREQIDDSVGATVGTFTIIKAKGTRIPVPPLAEQQRIVGVLDEAFAGLATAQANAEKNLQNARALFESHLQSVFTHRGKGWVEKPLSELCDIKHGFAFKGEFFTNKGDYVVLTPGNYYESGGYRDRGEKQKYYAGEIPPDYIMKEGDMLVAMTEQAAGLLGSPLLVPESNKFLHNQRLGLVTAKPGVPWTNEFFFHVFNTQQVRKDIHASASGVKVRHTSPTKIGEVVVAFPTSIPEQRKIVSTLAALATETQRLARLYQQKQAALAALKKSLLHQAFTGEL